jgi:predicted O-linked N-acetylglucosamine transferase (SPINDLY family)
MDYRITDSLADPPGMTEAFHSERLVRVDPCFLSYQISDDLPPPHPVPAESRGYVTFGCMNVIMKISKPTIELWAKVLKAVPQSKLLLKFRALTDPSTWSWVVETFAANGIGVDRLELLKHTKTYAEHLDVYGQIDVMLDPFPYNGTTTTCEALAMGLPVVALAGKIHVSRVGVSLLTNVGLPELIAQTPEDYVRICGEFAADLPRLKQLRLGLRDQMRASPLCDAAAFTRRLEAAYRTMWREWCGKQGER